jgi:cyanophycinase
MLITGSNQMEAIGSGLVMIVDGHEILHSNIADIPEGNPISCGKAYRSPLCKRKRLFTERRKFIESLTETLPYYSGVLVAC